MEGVKALADYKRLVSYMYNYENGMKKNNVGYARIEARNGQCKITIHIKAPSMNVGTLKTYIFKRINEELHCIIIGNTSIKNGIGELRTITKTDSLMDLDYHLEEMGGIIVYHSKEKFFGSEWDDNPIIIRNLIELETKKDLDVSIKAAQVSQDISQDINNQKDLERQKVNWISAQEIEKVIEEKKEQEKQLNDENKEIEKNILLDNLKTEDRDLEQTEINMVKEEKETEAEKESKKVENIKQEQNEEKVISEESKFIDNILKENKEKSKIDKTQTANKTKEQKENTKSTESKVREANIGMENYFESQVKKEKEEKEGYSEKKYTQNNEKSEDKDSIFHKYPTMYPFEDDEIIECVRIEPQDIGVLPMETWVLANNSFLLHGYYSYRHLILAKKRAMMGGYQYILGVPGIYQSREKFMANMFGFYQFKSIKSCQQKTGEFGYWYMPIIL